MGRPLLQVTSGFCLETCRKHLFFARSGTGRSGVLELHVGSLSFSLEAGWLDTVVRVACDTGSCGGRRRPMPMVQVPQQWSVRTGGDDTHRTGEGQPRFQHQRIEGKCGPRARRRSGPLNSRCDVAGRPGRQRGGCRDGAAHALHHTVRVSPADLDELMAVCASVLGLDHDDLIVAGDGGGFSDEPGRRWVVSDLAAGALRAWADGPLRSGDWAELVAHGAAGDDTLVETWVQRATERAEGLADLARDAAETRHLVTA